MSDQQQPLRPLAVIKVGGEVVADDAQLAGLAQNVQALRVSHDVVIVHGGGPQVTALQATLGQTATKVAGQRVTSAEDIFAVTACLAGTVNVTLCAALTRAGVPAFGCHGASGPLIHATKRPPLEVAGHGVVDYGEVGDVQRVDGAPLRALLGLGFIPVVATLGLDGAAGRILNVNGDVAAAAVAEAMGAALVVMITGVGGVFADHKDPTTRFPQLTVTEARAHIRDGIIRDGMVPKVEEALRLLAAGVGVVGIVGATHGDHVARLSAGDPDVGTRLVP